MKLMHITSIIIFVTISFSICCAQNSPKNNMNMFLSQGISEGLIADKFPKKLANELLEANELWVGKCPICDNVRNGFYEYTNDKYKKDKSLTKKEFEKGGTKAKQQIVEVFKSGQDISKQKEALRSLVDTYIQTYFERLDLNENQRKEMKAKLEAGRKTGMSRAGGGESFFCSSCDGACHKKPD